MQTFPTPPANTRLGFHYFPDYSHYTARDLRTWLPELQALGASWLVLNAPLDRAIPEPFLAGLLSAGIEPILHFHLPVDAEAVISPASSAPLHVVPNAHFVPNSHVVPNAHILPNAHVVPNSPSHISTRAGLPAQTTFRPASLPPFLASRLGPSSPNGLFFLFEAYARWGLHYVVLYDRPNTRSAWPAAAWAQVELVERFLDRFIPPAQFAVAAGLFPVFPPLQPGGDYWDTAFLRAALQGLERRGQADLLQRLVISAYADPGDRPLNWGSGGPERWPNSHPYFTPSGSQDQCGFRIFDWYLRIAEAVLGAPCPILLLGLGKRPGALAPELDEPARLNHALRSLALARALRGANGSAIGAASQTEPVSQPKLIIPHLSEPLDPVDPAVLAGNFWLLTAAQGSPHARQAWYQPDGSRLPAVAGLRRPTSEAEQPADLPAPVSLPALVSQPKRFPQSKQVSQPTLVSLPALVSQPFCDAAGIAGGVADQIRLAEFPAAPPSGSPVAISQSPFIPASQAADLPKSKSPNPPLPRMSTPAFAHYLLLPVLEGEQANWQLHAILPFVFKYRPTIGYSLEEAALAARVTVVGTGGFSAAAIDSLHAAGCAVVLFEGSGTEIATKLKEA